MDNCQRLCPLIAETGNIGFAMQAIHQSKSMRSRNVAQSLVAEKNYTSEHLRKRFRSTQQNGALMLTENSANNTNSDVDNTGKFGYGKKKVLELLLFYSNQEIEKRDEKASDE